MKSIPVFLLLFLIVNYSSIHAQEEELFESKLTAGQLINAPAMLLPFPQQISWDNEYLEITSIYAEQAEGLPIQFSNNKNLGPEEYHLAISRKEIVVEAATETGQFYALQTLRQLIQTSPETLSLPICVIKDRPAYPVRGYMLDVGRNFQSLESLKKQLDIMARYKLNVFHWHLTNRPAWRIESKRYPALTDAANHRPTRNPGKYHSYDEIRELINMEGLSFSTKPQEHSTYYYQKKTHFERLPNHKKEIIFLGDSITDGCEWSELFGNKKMKNRGISGDISQGVLDRLEEVTESKPQKVFLMIGINDLARGYPPQQLIQNTQLIIRGIQKASPQTKIYLQSLLPVSDHFGKFNNHTDKNEAVKTVNLALRKMHGGNITFVNLYEKFINDEGKLDSAYTNDGLHLNGNGYLLWKKAIEGFVK